MKHYWLAALVIGASPLAMAQQPHVVNAQLSTEPAGAGLAAVAGRAAHSGVPRWLGYEMAALAGSRFSLCSGDRQSPADDQCCGVYRLEDPDSSVRSSADEPQPTNMDVLVRIDHGTVWLNGKPLNEGYVPEMYRDTRSYPETTIPDDCYFVMGDHRSISSDSREFGVVERDLIYGKAVFIYWPAKDAGVVQ